MSAKAKKKKKSPPRLPDSPEFRSFRDCLKEAKRVLVSTHSLPDGDGLGTEVALYHYLKRARKGCRVYNPDRLPRRYRILDERENILLGPGEVEIWDTFDVWVIVDTNDARRVGPLWNELILRAKKIFFLDHHPETLGVGGKPVQLPPHATVVSDPEASSIGELIYHMFAELDLAKLNSDMALGIYVSVMTDTNSFRYARTTPQSHRIAAEMIELGVNPEEVYQAIYSSKEVSHLQLLGKMLQNVRVSAGGRLAWLQMDLSLRREHRASADDTQSFLNLLLLLKDAEVVCLFREEDDGRIRASMKSKGRVVINHVAMEFGGGGHEFAAGFSREGSMERVVGDAVAALEQALSQPGKSD